MIGKGAFNATNVIATENNAAEGGGLFYADGGNGGNVMCKVQFISNNASSGGAYKWIAEGGNQVCDSNSFDS